MSERGRLLQLERRELEPMRRYLRGAFDVQVG